MDVKMLCMGCMRELHKESVFCEYCGYKVDSVNSSRGLQPKTILNGKYLVGKIIGEGGFGITYLAYDMVLNYRVAIKEYFPSELVTRDTSTGIQTALTVLTGSREEQYMAGIERFINEARNLAMFNNLDGIVSVKEFFYENNTAYMVMEYVDGISLSQYLNNYGNRLPYQQVISMLMPIMNSLIKVHEGSIIHRDISPDNIMVSNDGRVKLIDFGAARMVDPDNKSLTVILKHGYAPEEQYRSGGNQGPWTDVYALAATIYRMITGNVPQEATDRIISGDKVVSVNILVPDVPKHISDAIMHGLAIKASDRPQTVSAFRKELEKGPKKKFPFFIIPIAAAVVLCIVGAVIAVNVIKNKQSISEPYSVATKPAKSKTSELFSEEESELPPVKVLTEEEKLAQWREYQDKIVNALGIAIEDYEEGVLYGCYDDYDFDGSYELFCDVWMMSGGNSTYVYCYADANRVWIEDDNGDFIDVAKESRQVFSLYGNWDLYLVRGTQKASQLGKQKFCYWYDEEYNFYGASCCTVWEHEPQKYKCGITQEENILFGKKSGKAHYYTLLGEEVLCGDTTIYYSPYYLNGQFGEMESCLIMSKQYSSIPDLINQINIYAEYIKKNNTGIFYYPQDPLADGGATDTYIINDILIDSVLYNEAGYFVFNYKCSCTFKDIGSLYDSSWTPGNPYYVSMVPTYFGEVIYTGDSGNTNKDSIEGLYAYVIVKYDGNEYTMLYSDSGYISTAVTENVLVTSKNPWE